MHHADVIRLCYTVTFIVLTSTGRAARQPGQTENAHGGWEVARTEGGHGGWETARTYAVRSRWHGGS